MKYVCTVIVVSNLKGNTGKVHSANCALYFVIISRRYLFFVPFPRISLSLSFFLFVFVSLTLCCANQQLLTMLAVFRMFRLLLLLLLILRLVLFIIKKTVHFLLVGPVLFHFSSSAQLSGHQLPPSTKRKPLSLTPSPVLPSPSSHPFNFLVFPSPLFAQR